MKQINRQTHRTQSALKVAFMQLLQESNYASITVGDIAKRANMGRSTFYRHYESKPDILLSWHEDIFRDLDLGHYTAEAWLDDNPPFQLTAFFERMADTRMPFHDFGNDGAYILREIGSRFTQQIESNLENSFSGIEMEIPLPVVAQALAGIYVWIFQWWIMNNPPYSSKQMTTYTHRMVQGIMLSATRSS
ncbi:MAG: TetR/AcrR family transcriptional regulator [Chloroflexota bacterium]